jgi:hypothetical protein
MGPQEQVELAPPELGPRKPSITETICPRLRDELTHDRYITDVVLGLCEPVAQAIFDARKYTDTLVVPPWNPQQYRRDVIHMLYVVGAESGGDPWANSVNWGCPRTPHLWPDKFGHEWECRWVYGGQRVPLGYVSHMGHLVEERAHRLLGRMVDPFDLYDSVLLAMALVWEPGGSGWYHWWSVSHGFNHLTRQYGIRAVVFCPPSDYWADVKPGTGPRAACGRSSNSVNTPTTSAQTSVAVPVSPGK